MNRRGVRDDGQGRVPGADISVAVGLAVAGGLYFLFSRGLDLGAEREAAARSREALLASAG